MGSHLSGGVVHPQVDKGRLIKTRLYLDTEVWAKGECGCQQIAAALGSLESEGKWGTCCILDLLL